MLNIKNDSEKLNYVFCPSNKASWIKQIIK